jgi:microcystin degradation protein MlrC
MIRIAVGGFLHETNTFAPTKATFDDFVHGGGWPAMAQGAGVLKMTPPACCARWCATTPSAPPSA